MGEKFVPRPRGRAYIVMTHEYEGQKEWAAELARQKDSEHLHLLERFAENTVLSKKTGQFMVSNLFEFLKKHDRAPKNPDTELLKDTAKSRV